MKKIYKLTSALLAILMILSCFSSVSFAAETKPKADYDAVKDSSNYILKKVTTKGYEVGAMTSTYSYDKSNRLASIERTTNGKKSNGTYCYYDNNGKLTDYWSDFSKIKYTYNKNGYCTKETSSANPSYTKTFSYDDKNYPITVKYKSNDSYSDFASTSKYTYKSGKISKVSYSAGEDDYYTLNYTYDANGNLTKISGKNGYEQTKKQTYTYDSKSQCTATTFGGWGRPSESFAFTYDKNGRLTKKVYTDDTNFKTTTTYTYDSNGKLTKEVSSDSYGKSTISYAYDENGNLKTKSYTEAGRKITESYSYTAVSKGYHIIHAYSLTRNIPYDIVLSDVSYTYDGKAKKPSVSIKGETNYLIANRDYKVKYSDNINVGKALLTITFIGEYALDGQKPITISYAIKSPKPAKPSNVKVTSKSATSVSLSWDKVKNAAKYEVYKYVESTQKYTKLATVTTNTATIKDLKASTAYKFCIKAVTADSVKSDYSTKVSAKTSAMAKVKNVKASEIKATSVTLTWDKASGAEKYEVYKYTASSKKYTLVTTVTTNKAIIKNLKSKTTYTYAVKAVSKAGSKGAYSELLKAKTK